MSDAIINILVVGKSGAGKSSFCNYIFGDHVFATGNGRPVTGWDEHFLSSSAPYEEFVLNLFDTVGIEANNLAKWEERLNEFLAERAPSSKTMPQNWMHSAIYVLNAAAARIEGVELRLIRKLRSAKLPVQIVLTMCDKAKPEEIQDMKSYLERNFPGTRVTEVCSVAVRKRSGMSDRFGREATLDELVSGLDTELAGTLIEAVCDRLQAEIKEMERKHVSAIQALDQSLFDIIMRFFQSRDDIALAEFPDFDVSGMLGNESEPFEQLNESIDSFLRALGTKSRAKITTNELVTHIRSSVDRAMAKANLALKEKVNEEVNALDSEDFWTVVAAVGKRMVGFQSFMKGEMAIVLDVAQKELDAQRAAAHQVISFMDSRRSV
ncbi:GTPase [Halomonas sp. GD1P12]|uniref:GTPase n=1 Tax=Halomonas sp. GD1P12 TaxID=2982691 RepID=UPI0021E367C7|nr:GTPase domain-containing protein [Halomonas sp. GD1P12]UYF99509.1 GTPase domain-containing protein [Halomonas sp. GD1P12]